MLRRHWKVILILAVVLAVPILVQWIHGPIRRPGRVPRPALDLALHEVMPRASAGGHPWIELYNPSDEPATLDGARIATGSGYDWTFPGGLPEVPEGGFVLVRLELPRDAPSPPAVRPVDGTVTVSAPAELAAPWCPSHGEATLYLEVPPGSGRSRLVSYLAWGREGSRTSRTAERLAMWPQPWYVALAETFGVYDRATELPVGGSVGRWPGSRRSSPESWAVYDRDEATPGLANAWPRPKRFTVLPGQTIIGTQVEIAWFGRPGDPSYQYELVSSSKGESVAEGTTDKNRFISEVKRAPGSYRFRVRRTNRVADRVPGATPLPTGGSSSQGGVHPELMVAPDPHEVVPVGGSGGEAPGPGEASPSGGTSPPVTVPEKGYGRWSGWLDFSLRPPPRRVSTPLMSMSYPPSSNAVVLGSMKHLLQNKDTRLLCLSGCDREHWNKPEPGQTRAHHGGQYCVPASVAMMASAYGGAALSQDRVAVYLKSAMPVDVQLSHGTGVAVDELDPKEPYTSALMWALNATGPTVLTPPAETLGAGAGWSSQGLAAATDVVFSPSPPSFAMLTEWLDQGRPVMALEPGHMVTVGGCDAYREGERDVKMVKLLDPMLTREVWVEWVSWLAALDDAGSPTPAPKGWWAGPATKDANGQELQVSARSDEDEVWQDSDGDGIMDFDENARLESKDDSSDSDGDGIEDLVEVASYVLEPDTGRCIAYVSYVVSEDRLPYGADCDGDDLRKEKDPDNDDDGCPDGDEDADKNGRQDDGETSCFDPCDCGTVPCGCTWCR